MVTDWVLIVIAIVLVLIAMYLVAVEQALTRVSRAAVGELKQEGIRGAERLESVIEDRARYVNVLLMVRLACETFAVVCVTVVCLRLVPQFEWVAMVIAGVIMLVASFVIIGVGPRTIGQQHSTSVALKGAPVARGLGAILWPIASVLIVIGNAVTPGKGYRQGPFATQAELREMVDLAEADSVIEEDERQMIHSVFELGDTIAREVMVPRTEMVFIEKDKRLRQAMSLALRSGFSRIPVIGDNLDDVVGIVYLKDLSRRTFEHREAEFSEKVEKLMRPVTFIPDSKPADELMREMQATRTHVAIVIDEYGGTAGLITIEDILEEIVGEIADEYDIAEIPESEQLSDDSWRISSRMQLDDFAEMFALEDLSEDSEGVETVGGLLANRLGVVPIAGSSIELDGLQLVAEMTAGRRNRVGAVLVTRARPAGDDSPESSGSSSDADDNDGESSGNESAGKRKKAAKNGD